MSVPLPEDGGYAALDLTPEQLKERTEDVLVALALEEPSGSQYWKFGKMCIGPIHRHWMCSDS